MIKQIWIAQCDICGASQNAKHVLGRYNDSEYTLPDGWIYGNNKNMAICSECAKKLNRGVNP